MCAVVIGFIASFGLAWSDWPRTAVSVSPHAADVVMLVRSVNIIWIFNSVVFGLRDDEEIHFLLRALKGDLRSEEVFPPSSRSSVFRKIAARMLDSKIKDR